MAIRSDIVVDFNPSPRVATVLLPSVEFIMQDVVDTLRDRESSFSGMSHPHLIDASGKEPLGGGVSVGITVALQNTRIEFEPRETPIQVGTVTATPTSPIADTQILEDNAADFVAAGVQRGAAIINFTDGSTATALEVLSTTQLRTSTLEGGTENDYDIGDVYEVYGLDQVSLVGGNLTAVDENQSPISPVSPTFGTQVLLTASSSATLQEQQDIQFSSFNGGVSVDLANKTGRAQPGTAFPAGTPRQPCDNWPDAVSIAGTRGFFRFFLLSDAVIPVGTVFSQITFQGDSAFRTSITLPPTALLSDCNYEQLQVTGDLAGQSALRNCVVNQLNFFSGTLVASELTENTILLAGGAAGRLINCIDGTAGLSLPTVDLGGSGQSLVVRNYSGGLRITNKTGPEEVSISLAGGRIVIDDSVDAGTIVLRGTGEWDGRDAYAGNATIVNRLEANAVWNQPVAGNQMLGTFGEFVSKKLLTFAKWFGLK